jgi:hypothetical protein
MKKLAILAVILVFAAPLVAWPTTADVRWAAPAAYEDNTPMPAADIKNYKIYYGNKSGGPYQFSVTVPGGTTSVQINNLTNGTWYFVATTVSVQDSESSATPEVSKVINIIRKPRAPVNFTIG